MRLLHFLLAIPVALICLVLLTAPKADAIPIVPIGLGGTGTSTAPLAGRILIGNGTGYDFVASSTIVSANGIVSLANVSSTNISNTGYITNVGSFTQRGIINTTGTIPTATSCGTDPSVVGTNLAGTITVGSGVTTACTLNFSAGYSADPSCVMTINTSAVTGGITSISSSSATFSFSATVGGGKIYYHCFANE